MKKGDNEIYFEVGPETNTCEIIEEPTVTLGDELQAALLNGMFKHFYIILIFIIDFYTLLSLFGAGEAIDYR